MENVSQERTPAGNWIDVFDSGVRILGAFIQIGAPPGSAVSVIWQGGPYGGALVPFLQKARAMLDPSEAGELRLLGKAYADRRVHTFVGGEWLMASQVKGARILRFELGAHPILRTLGPPAEEDIVVWARMETVAAGSEEPDNVGVQLKTSRLDVMQTEVASLIASTQPSLKSDAAARAVKKLTEYLRPTSEPQAATA